MTEYLFTGFFALKYPVHHHPIPFKCTYRIGKCRIEFNQDGEQTFRLVSVSNEIEGPLTKKLLNQ
jgi:hypothetical protein